MKKLLVLMLVASLCALANGVQMTLQISVGNNPEPEDSTIFLMPSESLALDIWSPNGWQNNGDNVYFGLVFADETICPATISGGVYHVGPAPDLSKPLGAGNDQFFPGSGGIYGQFMCMTVPGTAGIFVDYAVLHCEGPGGIPPHDTVIQLWTTADDWESVQMQDQVIIHCIPEPATIALLSLGGLLLRKRK
jgi:hypothetical protein